jgi:hypothetical protein
MMSQIDLTKDERDWVEAIVLGFLVLAGRLFFSGLSMFRSSSFQAFSLLFQFA